MKILASLASPSANTNLEGITGRFEPVVTKLRPIPPVINQQVQEYIKAYRHNRYKKTVNIESVELQDLYLSSDDLPSKSGAITGDMSGAGYRHAVYVEIPTWAVHLRILRSENYTLTDRGKALLGLAGINTDSVEGYNPAINPMKLNPGEKLFFLYSILDVDGDLIKPLYGELVASRSDFSRGEVGERIASHLQQMLLERLRHPSNSTERRLADKASAIVLSIKNQKSSGLGPRDSVATPRTEPLVDCGLLDRVDPMVYNYRTPNSAVGFISTLSEAESVGEFLETQLVSCALPFVDIDREIADPETRQQVALKQIASCYLVLRTGLGYCSIRELAVMAVARALNNGSPLFEIGDAEMAILAASKEHGRAVRFTKTRHGDIGLVRFDLTLAEGMARGD